MGPPPKGALGDSVFLFCTGSKAFTLPDSLSPLISLSLFDPLILFTLGLLRDYSGITQELPWAARVLFLYQV